MKRTVLTSFLALLVLTLAVGAAFASGTGEQGGTVKLTFWNGYTGPDRPTIEAMVKQFNDTHPNIQVAMEITPWDSLYQKLMPAFIAGTGPDIVGYSVSRVPEYVKAGRLAALDSYIGASKSVSRDLLVPGLVQGSTIGGKLYGVPMAFASMVMYYNKAQFTAAGLDANNPPKTLADLEAAWKKLVVKDASGNVTQYAQAIGIRDTVAMVPVVLWDYGADIVTPDGKSGLGSKAALDALTFLRRAFVEEKVSPVGLTGQEADNLFAASKASIEWNGPWALPGFRKAGIDTGIAEMPSGPAGRTTWGGDTVLVMNKDSKAKAAVWTFMEYWNGKDAQRMWSTQQAFPPTRTDMANDPDIVKNADLSFFIKGLAYAKIYMAGQTKSAEIESSVLVPLYESVFGGSAEPAAALQKADAQLSQILSAQ